MYYKLSSDIDTGCFVLSRVYGVAIEIRLPVVNFYLRLCECMKERCYFSRERAVTICIVGVVCQLEGTVRLSSSSARFDPLPPLFPSAEVQSCFLV